MPIHVSSRASSSPLCAFYFISRENTNRGYITAYMYAIVSALLAKESERETEEERVCTTWASSRLFSRELSLSQFFASCLCRRGPEIASIAAADALSPRSIILCYTHGAAYMLYIDDSIIRLAVNFPISSPDANADKLLEIDEKARADWRWSVILTKLND